MAELPDGLLSAVKAYLKITWQDDATDNIITGYINRGMARLQQIAGASLDFTKEEQPRSLLFDYCRYANSQALEVFEQNFQAELLDLSLRTEASFIDNLVVRVITGAPAGYVYIAVSPSAAESSIYFYRVGTNLKVPSRMDVCTPPEYFEWDGYFTIPALSGQDVLLVEVNDEYEAIRAGKVTVN